MSQRAPRFPSVSKEILTLGVDNIVATESRAGHNYGGLFTALLVRVFAARMIGAPYHNH